MRQRLAWFVAVALLTPAVLSAQVPTDKLGWDQAAASLAVANTYQAVVELDGVIQPAQVVTCTGTASPFVCTTAIPATTPGPHTARIRVSETVNGVTLTSAFSVPLSFTLRAVPATPANPRIL